MKIQPFLLVVIIALAFSTGWEAGKRHARKERESYWLKFTSPPSGLENGLYVCDYEDHDMQNH